MITRMGDALRAIRRCSYLNEFLSRDIRYRAHSVPGGESVNCPVISRSGGEWLIRDGLVVKCGERVALEGRSTLGSMVPTSHRMTRCGCIFALLCHQ